MVHEVAATGFGAQAEAYERARPTYPPEAVAWVVEGSAIGPGTRVADLGAGTGKLTRLLVPSGARVVAVEPVPGMRREFRRAVPGVPALAAVSEALPFTDRSLDAVTAAQAFHWFDPIAAPAEIRRVLRVGGSLVLLWNGRDRSVDWVDRVWAVMDRVEHRAPWRDHEGAGRDPRAWRDDLLVRAPGFAPPLRATFHHDQELDPAGVLDRIRGVSHVAVLPPAEQAGVLDEVREILATHPDTRDRDRLRIPYRVDAYRMERVG